MEEIELKIQYEKLKMMRMGILMSCLFGLIIIGLLIWVGLKI